jgi:hypothetical protein
MVVKTIVHGTMIQLKNPPMRQHVSQAQRLTGGTGHKNSRKPIHPTLRKAPRKASGPKEYPFHDKIETRPNGRTGVVDSRVSNTKVTLIFAALRTVNTKAMCLLKLEGKDGMGYTQFI